MKQKACTIDNLCASDKKHILTMLDHLNALKEKSHNLEQDIKQKKKNIQEIENINQNLNKNVEHLESELYKVINKSKSIQSEIEELSITFQRNQSNCSKKKSEIHDLESDIKLLTHKYNQLQREHRQFQIKTGVFPGCAMKTIDTNTTSTMQNDCGIQYQEDIYSNSNELSSSSQISQSKWNDIPELDEELIELIRMLNK